MHWVHTRVGAGDGLSQSAGSGAATCRVARRFASVECAPPLPRPHSASAWQPPTPSPRVPCPPRSTRLEQAQFGPHTTAERKRSDPRTVSILDSDNARRPQDDLETRRAADEIEREIERSRRQPEHAVRASCPVVPCGPPDVPGGFRLVNAFSDRPCALHVSSRRE